jgi:ParB-like chromosome segregation protein Spo0J
MSAKKKGADAAPLSMPEPARVRLADLAFAPYNPRTMPAAHMRALKASLLKHGLVLNLVVQREGMVLIGGHQRVTAVRELCAERGLPEPEHAWATVLDVSDDDAKQLNVALNAPGLAGEFDPYKLGALFQDVLPRMSNDDFPALGFDRDEVAELVKLAMPPDDQAAALEADALGLAGFAKSVTLTVEFETVADRDAAKDLLREQAIGAKAKAGTVLLKAIRGRQATLGKPSGNGKPAAKNGSGNGSGKAAAAKA